MAVSRSIFTVHFPRLVVAQLRFQNTLIKAIALDLVRTNQQHKQHLIYKGPEERQGLPDIGGRRATGLERLEASGGLGLGWGFG